MVCQWWFSIVTGALIFSHIFKVRKWNRLHWGLGARRSPELEVHLDFFHERMETVCDLGTYVGSSMRIHFKFSLKNQVWNIHLFYEVPAVRKISCLFHITFLKLLQCTDCHHYPGTTCYLFLLRADLSGSPAAPTALHNPACQPSDSPPNDVIRGKTPLQRIMPGISVCLSESRKNVSPSSPLRGAGRAGECLHAWHMCPEGIYPQFQPSHNQPVTV